MTFHLYRSIPVLLVMLLLPGFLAETAHADAAKLELSSGATLNAAVVQEKGDAYFIDLGFDIIRIPKNSVSAFELDQPGDGDGAADADPEIDADAGLVRLNSESVPYYQRIKAPGYSTLQEMVEQARLAVVHIKAPSKRGTGFIINEEGYIVSNFHVVEQEKFLDVTTYYREGGDVKKKTYQGVELLAYSSLMDISLLRIPEEDLEHDKITFLPIAPPTGNVPGTVAVAIGNPGMGAMALDHTVSEGIVSSEDRNISDILYLQTTAAVNPGNSGGPLINAKGEVIGLVTYKAYAQDNIGFAMPAFYIRHFIENQQGFAYPEDKLNTGIRYLSPK